MGRIVVDVMPKPDVPDTKSQSMLDALRRVGHADFTEVRQGKRFVLSVEGEVTKQTLDAAREAAAEVLSNTAIEDVVAVRAMTEGS